MASDGNMYSHSCMFEIKNVHETSLTSVFDFKQKLLTTSLAIYNGSIDFL
jgi:hypothetical protein